MNDILKSTLQINKMLCDTLDKNGLGVKTLDNKTKRTTYDVFRHETIRMLAYLSQADGVLSEQEVHFINEHLETYYSVDDLKRYVKNDTKMSELEETVPLIMRLIVNSDNVLFERNVPKSEPACITIYQLFELLGKQFLACDEYVDEREVAILTKILSHMREYYEQNDKSFIAYKEQAIKDGKTIEGVTDNPSEEAGAEPDPDMPTLEELLEELRELVGLTKVKEDVQSLINLVQIMKIRQERGLKQSDISLHLVFSGNPGTGKTTVARLLSQIYCRIGVLSKGHLVEVDRSGLVSGYVGQTAIKTSEVIQKALGGILFIDEAYALTANRGENDFGQEAVDTLLKAMEDNRDDLAVIVAGYPDLMEDFLSSNPGLRSRFNKFIFFDDYTPEELLGIFDFRCKKAGYTATEEAREYVAEYFKQRYETRDETFANGRDVRNFLERAMVFQANRLAESLGIAGATSALSKATSAAEEEVKEEQAAPADTEPKEATPDQTSDVTETEAPAETPAEVETKDAPEQAAETKEEAPADAEAKDGKTDASAVTDEMLCELTLDDVKKVTL